ncbi:predicted protein [Streptomyces viridosporus ATCC 14672]|uniref:Predicted protein n=1 Tax=Streptomyces viridosporus (strain ATCC 14672 / DSM 40746 / JCM 4963 / KCTC 9882 / NRRL B-12104 / FH 1290) TaxID=566461 RepID=D6A014_STRV1|nr:predicted protein [Streptomyces viridosporus ATCC 14672]
MSADRLRFRTGPRTDVRFGGSPRTRSVTSSTRTNLPGPVDVGVTYRNAQVRYRLANTLDAEDLSPGGA